MDSIVLQPSSTAQWHALIQEAGQASHIILDEELESYLVFLLMRFADQPELVASVLAEEYLESHQQRGAGKRQGLRDVGDKCLLFAGLYPERARKKRVKISYFVDLGQAAYGSLSEIHHHTMQELFYGLYNSFVDLMDVLSTARTLSRDESLTPLEAMDLWQDTKSQHAYNVLQQITSSEVIITGSDDKPH